MPILNGTKQVVGIHKEHKLDKSFIHCQAVRTTFIIDRFQHENENETLNTICGEPSAIQSIRHFKFIVKIYLKIIYYL